MVVRNGVTDTGEQSMSVVWVANAAGHPYYKVERLLPNVELRYLTLDEVNPLEVDRLFWHIARGIVQYVRKEDYLLISGSPMVNAACLSLWLQNFGECNVIQWNAAKREYERKHVELENLRRVLEAQLIR